MRTQPQTPRVKPEQQSRRQAKDALAAVSATIRWARVFPVDFEGEDTSLTQEQLEILK